MREKTCCFTGHREIIDDVSEIKSRLTKVLVKLIKSGVVYFGAGGALGFDTLAAQTVVELKSIYPHIKLILVLPCRDQTKGWRQEDVEIYENIKLHADKVKILSQHYYRGCMHARNRHLVDCSGVCVCYKRKNTGGTAYTVKYAKQTGLTVLEI